MTANEPDHSEEWTARPAGSVDVRRATPHDREGWNGFVARSGAPPLNRFEWAGIVEAVYDVPARFLLAEDDQGAVRGVLGLYETRSLRGRRRVYSLRHGLVADDDVIADALVTSAMELFPATGVADIAITSGYRRHELPVQTERRVAPVLALVDDGDEMWSRLRSKTRNMIRKAQRAGVEVQAGSERLDEFCHIYERHMIAMGIPIHRREFFRHTLDALGDDAELLVAVLDQEVIGGTLVLYAPGAAIYPYQAAAGHHLDKAPNQTMIWEAMRAAARRGIPRLDMGESKQGGSTYRFKHNFGGQDEDVHYYHPLGQAGGTDLMGDDHDEEMGPSDPSLPLDLLSRLPPRLSRAAYRSLRRRGRIV